MLLIKKTKVKLAFNRQQINPLDLQPRKGVGIDIPFRSKRVFETTYTTAEALRNNLITYFLTGRGERYLNPDFGSPLRPLLFENMTQDNIVDVKRVVEQDLELYFPQVLPSSIDVVGDPSRNLIQFSLSYKVSNTNITDEVVIDFNL